ncbi:hypothetical protein BJ912DRAFT_231297 [Pholiota molesta]|nr:hypothetical protein BJ912DRAFT_231297 [Pholiota molesta]
MYTHDHKILRILVVAYVMEFLSVIIIQSVQKTYGLKVNNSETIIQASHAFCVKERITPWTFVVWIPLVLFEFLVFSLALSLGIKYCRAVGSHKIFSDYRNSNRKTPLMYILLRDSTIFPFIFSLSCMINFMIFVLAEDRLRPVIAHIASIFPIVLSIIFGSRLILNLRESYHESYNSGFDIQIDTSAQLESNVPFPTQIPLSNFATPPAVDS